MGEVLSAVMQAAVAAVGILHYPHGDHCSIDIPLYLIISGSGNCAFALAFIFFRESTFFIAVPINLGLSAWISFFVLPRVASYQSADPSAPDFCKEILFSVATIYVLIFWTLVLLALFVLPFVCCCYSGVPLLKFGNMPWWVSLRYNNVEDYQVKLFHLKKPNVPACHNLNTIRSGYFHSRVLEHIVTVPPTTVVVVEEFNQNRLIFERI